MWRRRGCAAVKSILFQSLKSSRQRSARRRSPTLPACKRDIIALYWLSERTLVVLNDRIKKSLLCFIFDVRPRRAACGRLGCLLGCSRLLALLGLGAACRRRQDIARPVLRVSICGIAAILFCLIRLRRRAVIRFGIGGILLRRLQGLFVCRRSGSLPALRSVAYK